MWPHEPQFAESVPVSTQLDPHMLVGERHVQVPPLQSAPMGHAWPHEPQFAGFVVVSMHTPVHDIVDPMQLARHMPALHTSPAAQT